jgi:hypothetical protein
MLSPTIGCEPETLAILSMCTHLEDFCVFDAYDKWLPSVVSPVLTRLYATCESLLPSTHPLFSNLTHLHLGGDEDDVASTCDALAALPKLPKLTHLSFGGEGFEFVRASHKILELSQFLCVLVFFEHSKVWHWTHADIAQVTRDVRFVVMPRRNTVDHWYARIQTGRDYWGDAEAFVAKRRTGEIDRTCITWTWA